MTNPTPDQRNAFASVLAQAGTRLEQITKMNTMYRLPVNSTPHLNPIALATSKLAAELPSQRIKNFMATMYKEVIEGEEIIANLVRYEELRANAHADPAAVSADQYQYITELGDKCLTDLGDWFTDINVYAESEALKFGLNSEQHFNIVMTSNFTKLDADGMPIVNAEGKVEKGPNFQGPEYYINLVNQGTTI